ncbi:hypothetical protein HZC00_05045 [Candidatus Kaiserbacteria bacterium]|nr:hypothetical protein [Candidatus Kaiserbacteria bacterium]
MGNTTNVKIIRDEKAWEVEVKAEISAEALDSYRTKALAEVQKGAKMDGFRPGKAPIEAVLKLYGEDTIMRRAAEMAIQHELPEILVAQQVLVIEAPHVTTDTPVAGKALPFTAKAPMAPRVELGDYKATAQKHREITDDLSVTDKEHEEAMTHIRRERARIDKIEAGIEPQAAAEESRKMEPKDLPEIDDTFAQTIGYADAAAFSEALRGNIKHEKELKAGEKRRSLILEELVKGSKVSYPARLREYELDDMEARIKDDLARTGTSYEAYLAEIKKTREELRDTWKDAADTRTKVRLILAEIARVEHIEPSIEALDHELQHAREHYKDADPNILRTHIAHAMRNEATLRFLEGNQEKVGHTEADH